MPLIRRTMLLLTLLCVCQMATAQQYMLTGMLKMNTGEQFPYKLIFTEAGGHIKGYSLTYKEPAQIRTSVTGTLNRSGRTLSFRENEIVVGGNINTRAYMCLVEAELDYSRTASGDVLTGDIDTHEADRTACTGGTVEFRDPAELKRLFVGEEQFDTVITMGRKNRPAPPSAVVAPPPPTTEKITSGSDKYYEWHSDTAVVELWDGGNVDGDRITVIFNGETYLNNYYLLKQKKTLRLPLKPTGMNTMAIIAENEGSEPPNTADMVLYDGAMAYSIVAYNNKGQTALVKMKRVK
jgi:hypothetical protein